MFIVCNAVPGIDIRSIRNSYSCKSACLATTIYAYSATDFVLVFYCYFMISTPQPCWYTLLCPYSVPAFAAIRHRPNKFVSALIGSQIEHSPIVDLH